jgi:predicted DNA-binding protein (UPF0278 family)
MNLYIKSRLDSYKTRWIYKKLKHFILMNGVTEEVVIRISFRLTADNVFDR